MKVMDTATLVAVNRKITGTRKIKRIQNLNLDPDGVHVIGFHMIHERPGAVDVRSHVMVKMKDKPDPAEIWLDIPIKEFNKLPNLDEKGIRV